jgi:hypothetical protein
VSGSSSVMGHGNTMVEVCSGYKVLRVDYSKALLRSQRLGSISEGLGVPEGGSDCRVAV